MSRNSLVGLDSELDGHIRCKVIKKDKISVLILFDPVFLPIPILYIGAVFPSPSEQNTRKIGLSYPKSHLYLANEQK
jgi:hypothetical protein